MKRVDSLSDSKMILSLLMVIFLTSVASPAFAIYPENSFQVPQGTDIDSTEAQVTEYIPGEVIVQLTESAGSMIDRKLLPETLQIQPMQTGLPSMDRLNAKYKAKKIEPVFKALKAKQLRSGKSYSQLLEETKIRFQRSKKAHEDSKVIGLLDFYKIEFEDKTTSVLNICRDYKNDPNIKSCEPNYIAHVQMVPNDPYYSSSGSWGQAYQDMWGLHQINMEEAWDVTQGQGVLVAVVDTGLDSSHPDIASNIWTHPGEIPRNGIDDDGNGYIDDVRGFDFVNNDNDPSDGHGHGTHVSGTIAALGNNGIGIIGVAPQAKIMPLKGLSDGGSGTVDQLAVAISYATHNGGRVIHMSWGGFGSSDVISRALDEAYAVGVVLVAAAGNANTLVSQFFPANHPHVICIAAWSYDNARASFSNFGDQIDVTAPGVDALSLRAVGTDMYRDGQHFVPMGNPLAQYYRANGTSMAAPHVSGVAALLLALYPTLSPDLVELIINSSAQDVLVPGRDIYSGNGLTNARNTILTAQDWIGNPRPDLLVTNTVARILNSQEGQVEAEVVNAGLATATNVVYRVYSGDPIQGSIIAENTIEELVAGSHQSITLNYSLTTFPNESVTIQVDPDGTIAEFFEGNNNVTTPLTLLRIGWPQQMGSYAGDSSPSIGDLDGDGTSEIVVGSGSFEKAVYAFHADGTLVAGWPMQTSGFVPTPPALVDLDGDGKLEVIVGAVGGVYVWRQSSSNPNVWENYPGWPKSVNRADSSPVVIDLDGNGSLEIIVGDYWGDIYAWHADGQLVTGWPRNGAGGKVQYGAFRLAAGDIDGDQKPEIVSTSYDGKIYLWKANGVLVSGWPVTASSYITSSPALTDFDNDNKLEIIVGDQRGKLYAFHADGTLVVGWPITLGGPIHDSSPAIADLDGDGQQEIIVGTVFPDNKIYVLHPNGSALQGWPKQLPARIEASPAIADLDNDGRFEVVIGTMDGDGKVYAWHADGTPVRGWPQSTGTLSANLTPMVRSTAAIADLDGNGTPEIVALGNADAKVYVWNVLGAVPGHLYPWSTFQHDYQRTGRFNLAPVLDSIDDQYSDEGDPLGFHISAYDVDDDPLTYSASNLPLGAFFDTASAQFNWTPTYDQAGRYDITFIVSDGELIDSETITITVNNVNQAPILDPIGNKTVRKGDALTFTISATDLDGDSLTYTASPLPLGATFDLSTRVFSWTPPYGYLVGSYTVSFTVSDQGSSDSETIQIDVVKRGKK